ncbi:MAG: serine/threonine protein kinase [Candidatus Obscuribacterales bacterium]|nr:serine/threonine protein kinase [Candidatus Obscuribacterales bacterium]
MPESYQKNGFRIGKSQKARLLPGYVIDNRFEIVQLVGDGSLSSVYKGRDLRDNKIVAVKLLHTSAVEDYDEIVRLKKEGRVLSGIDCANVATIYQFGLIEEKLPYVVTEFLVGFNLKDILDTQAQSLGADIAILVGLGICDALIAAHAAGIVHGDLKPSNVMIVVEEDESETVKVLDFGLARNLATTAESITTHLAVTGLLTTSAPYMSPERCLGNQLDVRSDIYSLGCILYEMLTGRPPFLAHDPIAIVRQHLSEELSFSPSDSPVFVQLQKLILKAIAKDPSARYDNVEQFKEALALIKANDEESASPIRIIPHRAVSSPNISRLALIVAAAAAAIAALIWMGKQVL